MTVNSPYISPTVLNRQVAAKFEQDFQRLSAELSSGGESANYGSVVDVKQFLNQEVMLTGIEKYQNGNLVSRQKLNYISANLGVMRDIIGDFQEQLSLARSNSFGDDTQLSSWVNAKISYLNSLLSTTFNGEYVFSGTAINTVPIMDLTTLPPVGVGDPVDYSYYLGSTTPIQFHANDNDLITMNVFANDQGIAELIMALRTCSQLQGGQRDSQMATSMNLCQSSLQHIISTQGILDSKGVLIDNIQDQLDEFHKNLEENIQRTGYRSQTDIFQDFIQSKISLSLSNFVTTSALNAVRDLIDRMPL